MKKVSRDSILNYRYVPKSFDCSGHNRDDYNRIIAMENGLTEVAYSEGVCGVNGAVFQGTKTRTYYYIPSRCQALFIYLQTDDTAMRLKDFVDIAYCSYRIMVFDSMGRFIESIDMDRNLIPEEKEVNRRKIVQIKDYFIQEFCHTPDEELCVMVYENR